MKVSVYDLAYIYKAAFNPTRATRPLLHNLIELLNKGWTAKEILGQLRTFKKHNPNDEPAGGDLLIYFTGTQRREQNLIRPQDINFHQELLILPKLPVLDVNSDTGEIVQHTDDYFMEPRASYTIDDLLTYYYKKMSQKSEPWLYKRYIGALRYLLTPLTLDHLLYTIDAVGNMIRAGNIIVPSSPTALHDYSRHGMELMQACATETALQGGYKVVLRKRVPLDRRRGTVILGISALSLHES